MVILQSSTNLTLLLNNETIKSTTVSPLVELNVTNSKDAIHFCQKQLKMSKTACCNFVKLINDTNRFPFCNFSSLETQTNTLNNSHHKPVYLDYPNEVHEDHVTFIFGIALLISIAGLCTFIMSKLTRPNMFGRVPITYMTNTPQTNDCSYLMWLPYCNYRGSSMLFYLRGVTCGNGRSDISANNSASVSIVSQSSINFLPSYQSAASCSTSSPMTASTMISPISLPPPPAYEENIEDRMPVNTSFSRSLRGYNSNEMPLLGKRNN
uniref:CX domain-containing protein n=1 Tax=Parastrongyloides trichosuri TaxID=131310 RepID=A0A0N5A3D6_PARTI